LENFLLELAGWATLAGAAGVVAAALWLSLPPSERVLLGPQRHRDVSWTAVELGIVLFLTEFALVLIAAGCLDRLGFYSWLYGPEFRSPLQAVAGQKPPALDSFRATIWATLFALPMQVVAIPGILYLGSGTRPFQIGLTSHRWRQNIVLGFFAYLAVTPFVEVVNVLVTVVYQAFLHDVPQDHLLVVGLSQTDRSVDWAVVIALVVLQAPIIEEMYFRGVFQKWLEVRDWGGTAAVAVALAWTSLRVSQENTWGPFGFAILASPGAWFFPALVRRLIPDGNVARAIYGTALVFAVFHSAWPQPVPLFVLGLALGYLAYRTQSLIPPMVLHALFNGATCVTLGYASWRGQAP
jgi:membrane protease YdiL (CAAX protease family)